MSVTKWFSLEEANAMLPFVDQELKKMQALKQQFEEKYVELREMKNELAEKPHKEKDPFFVMEAELEFIQIEVRGLIQNFQTTGVELKDIETGLVDFPSMLEGHEVLLCWKQGEDRIRYYHSKEDGFAGRKPISE
ncbi:hypothetical protein GCM10008018_30370 [Paenibacillus marchantiophytorum]|uniref:DUF2203 family protein n=1 Tax=Paenibacillus marchantiophytorum TaxID=1619310 RepID=A0ABQ1EQB6_9BACL|nr:DUF2203 domain-containing protein [Paenibacillus marchantiophytorum]GFZ82396.1 hypothetical protein GCM10008018_30370 [Paenibacillus marchantiophytorum]